MIRRLPDADHITARLIDTPPRDAEATGSGPWLAMTSDATDPAMRFEVYWEAQVVTAALWRQRGESNSALSGGGLTFDTARSDGSDNEMHYAFADDAEDYLFTDANDDPSPLTIPDDQLRATIESAAKQMHVTLDSIQEFTELGTNVLITATAPSMEGVNTNINPVGHDPGQLEGACLVIVDASGNLLDNWSYSTGLQTGSGQGSSLLYPNGYPPTSR